MAKLHLDQSASSYVLDLVAAFVASGRVSVVHDRAAGEVRRLNKKFYFQCCIILCFSEELTHSFLVFFSSLTL